MIFTRCTYTRGVREMKTRFERVCLGGFRVFCIDGDINRVIKLRTSWRCYYARQQRIPRSLKRLNLISRFEHDVWEIVCSPLLSILVIGSRSPIRQTSPANGRFFETTRISIIARVVWKFSGRGETDWAAAPERPNRKFRACVPGDRSINGLGRIKLLSKQKEKRKKRDRKKNIRARWLIASMVAVNFTVRQRFAVGERELLHSSLALVIIITVIIIAKLSVDEQEIRQIYDVEYIGEVVSLAVLVPIGAI